MTAEAIPDSTLERIDITRERFEEVFADLLAMPAYLETVEITEEMMSPLHGENYNQAVELARDKIYEYPGITDRQRENIDHQFLLGIFASSTGAEERFVALGFKPVCLEGNGYSEEYMAKKCGSAPLALLESRRVFDESEAYAELGFTKGMFRTLGDAGSSPYYLYNKPAVERVAQLNSGVLLALGFDVTKPADEIAEDVFGTGTHPVAESILKGYAPITAIVFYLAYYPGDLDPKVGLWGVAAAQNGNINARQDGFWHDLEKILNPEQLEMAKQLSTQPEMVEELGVLEEKTGNTDYIYASSRNANAQKVWEACGMKDYLTRLRVQLSSGDSEDRRSDAYM